MKHIMLSLGCAVAVAGCSAVAGVGDAVTRPFAASGFDAVRVGGSDTVNIVRGTMASVVARGDAAQLDRLDIRTDGTTLVIGRKSSMSIGWSGKPVVVTVTMPSIRAAEVSGSADVSVDRAEGAAFAGSVSGSAGLKIADLRAATTKLQVSGSGSIDAAGETGTLTADVSGSGDLDARALKAESATIAVSGSGGAKAFARQSATLSVGGSGNIEVAGTTRCTISERGSGSARCTG